MFPGERSIDEVLRSEYPRTRVLASGQEITLRPLQPADRARLLAFFRRLPADERGRFFRDNVADPALVAQWCNEMDVTKLLPIVALAGDRIVADGTIRRERQQMKAHVGQVRLSVDPEYRRLGLGRVLMRELLDLAPELGLSWVDVEVVSSDVSAIAFLEKLAFQKAGVLPRHAQNPLGGREDDLVFMTRPVGDYLEPDVGGQE